MTATADRSTRTTTMLAQLAKHAHELRYDDLPARVVEKTKDHLVHNLGLALRGQGQPHGQQAVRMARALSAPTLFAQPSDDDRDDDARCTVIGTVLRVAPLDAAFANTTLMRADGMDDVLFPGGIHAGLVTMPAALALGEDGHLSGRDVMAAIVAGYDVMGIMSNGEFAWAAGAPRRPTAAFGVFGAATVAARLLGLDREETAHALGYAAHTAMGLAEGEPITHWYSLLTRSGLMSALAAREGGVAAPTVLEGPFGFFRTFFGEVPPTVPEALTSLGEHFAIEDATIKRYPGTAANIVPIELALQITERHQLTPANVTRIELKLPVERRNFLQGHAPGPFCSRASAVSSVVFQVASVVVDGRHDADNGQRYDDPDIQAVSERIDVTLVPGRPLRYAEVIVTTSDGRKLAAEGDDHAFPRAEWQPWLTANGADLLPSAQLQRIAALVADLESLDDVSHLLAQLRPTPP